jgi:hypothetical protein
LTIADLGARPSKNAGKVVHEVSVSDATGGVWFGRVSFADARDGRETPEQIARALLELVQGHQGAPTEALAMLSEPIPLFEGSSRQEVSSAEDPRMTAPAANLSQPDDGSGPQGEAEGPLERILDTYDVPRVVPFPVKLVIYFILIGIPVPVLWWLVLPHSVATIVFLGLLQIVIVFGGLFRIFLSAELTRLPRREPMQPPSARGLDPPPPSR